MVEGGPETREGLMNFNHVRDLRSTSCTLPLKSELTVFSWSSGRAQETRTHQLPFICGFYFLFFSVLISCTNE